MMKRYALFCDTFLTNENRFIYEEISNLNDFKPIIFARKSVNRDIFPWVDIHTLESGSFQTILPSSFDGLGISSGKKFLDLFESEKVDFCHGYFGSPALFAMEFAKKKSLPLVVTLSGLDVTALLDNSAYNRARYFRSNYLQLVEYTALFITNSRETKELFIELGCPEEKIFVYPQGIAVNDYIFKKEHNEKYPCRVILKGSEEEQYGIKYGIKAFSQINKQYSKRLDIIFTGKNPTPILKYINSLPIRNQITLHESPGFSFQTKLISDSDIAVIPSVTAKNQSRESSSRFILEAASSGLPVVATCHSRNADTVEDNITGFIVPERDTEALADRMEYLMSHPDSRKSFGQAGRAKIEFQFDIVKSSKKLSSFFNHILAL